MKLLGQADWSINILTLYALSPGNYDTVYFATYKTMH
jgi:hypothetical protein